MEIVLNYTDETREAIINEQEAKGLILIGDQRHFDGNFLTFTDEPSIVVEPTPPLSTHWAVVDSINLGEEKPVIVKRNWEGKEYTVACYASEVIKRQYIAGNIAIGDYVLVEFLEDRADRAVVFSKVFKTW